MRADIEIRSPIPVTVVGESGSHGQGFAGFVIVGLAARAVVAGPFATVDEARDRLGVLLHQPGARSLCVVGVPAHYLRGLS